MARFLARCALVALVLSLAAPGSFAGDQSPEAPKPQPGASPPGSEPTSGTTSEVQKLVDELMPLVAEIRGLEWKHGVPAQVLTREELQTFLKEQLDKEVTPEEIARDNRIVRRLGLMKADEDLVTMQMLMLKEMVAGAYDPETKKLYLIEGFEGAAQKPTLVHELIHALDDQHYDLYGMEEPYRENDPDRQFAIRCLFEGSAEYARRVFQNRDHEAAKSYYKQMASNEKAMAGQLRVMKKVPTHMLLATLLHYRMGPNFVTQACGKDYKGGMQRLFDDQPTTQEHILHPYKWLGPKRDYPRQVVWGADFTTVGGEGWKKLDEHTVGELDLATYLDYFLGDKNGRLNTQTMGIGRFVTPTASRAAAGWDAGRVQYVDSPDDEMVIVTAFAFDSNEDAADAANFIGAALRAANGDAWKGEGWNVTDDHARTFDYTGKHGRGRIMQRGREVLQLDGAPAKHFDAFWSGVLKTRFTQDERDKGDALADPFGGYAVVDRKRGLGLKLPAGWSAEESDRTPLSFADATNGSVRMSFMIADQEVSEAGLPRIGGMILGAMFKEEKAKPFPVMRTQGLRHGMPAGPGQAGFLYLGSDAARTYVVIVAGPPMEIAKAHADIERLLAGVPTPKQGAAETEPPPVGIRSIPGY